MTKWQAILNGEGRFVPWLHQLCVKNMLPRFQADFARCAADASPAIQVANESIDMIAHYDKGS